MSVSADTNLRTGSADQGESRRERGHPTSATAFDLRRKANVCSSLHIPINAIYHFFIIHYAFAFNTLVLYPTLPRHPIQSNTNTKLTPHSTTQGRRQNSRRIQSRRRSHIAFSPRFARWFLILSLQSPPTSHFSNTALSTPPPHTSQLDLTSPLTSHTSNMHNGTKAKDSLERTTLAYPRGHRSTLHFPMFRMMMRYGGMIWGVFRSSLRNHD